MGAAKGRGDEAEFERLRALVAEKKSQIATLNEEAKAEDAALTDLLMGIPNLPDDSIPNGGDEDHNVEIHRFGTPRHFDFDPVEHFDIPAIRPGMDFKSATKLAGRDCPPTYADKCPSRFQAISNATGARQML